LFHYPQNDDVFDPAHTEHSFIVGDALKVSPVLEAGKDNFDSYFPNDKNGTWVSMRNFAEMITVDENK
jgi:alpha-glucosidase (family GH31 glycosyl hydrolase)